MTQKRIWVKAVSWLCESIQEAVVTLSDGELEMNAFSHPFEQHEGDQFLGTISTFNHYPLVRGRPGDECSFMLTLQETLGCFSHQVRGVIVGLSPCVVQVGGFLIHIDGPIAKDLNEGDVVEFVVERFDVS